MPETYAGPVAFLKSEDPHDRTSGWEKLISEGLKVYLVRGDHLSMLAEPNLKSLAQTLKKCLTEAQESARTGTLSFELSSQAQCEETPSIPRRDAPDRRRFAP